MIIVTFALDEWIEQFSSFPHDKAHLTKDYTRGAAARQSNIRVVFLTAASLLTLIIINLLIQLWISFHGWL